MRNLALIFVLVIGRGLSAQALRALVSADRSGAAMSGVRGLASLDTLLAPDVVLVYPGAPIIAGHDRVAAFLGRQAVLSTRVTWDASLVELSTDSTFAVAYGSTFSRANDSGPVLGRFASAWRRGPGGMWKLVVLCLTGIPSGEVVLTTADSAAMQPLPPVAGPSAFSAADRAFAARASRTGASEAFGHFAASDAVLLGTGTAPMVRGAKIAVRMRVTGANSSRWKWWPVFAFGDTGGTLGVTVGQAEIADRGPGGGTNYSEYVTLWRRTRSGAMQFILDAGNPWPRVSASFR